MAQTRVRIGPQLQQSSTPGSIITSNTSNESQWSAPSTGADHLWFYDHSATATVPLTLGTNLSISGTTLNATAGAGGYTTIQEEGSTVGPGNTTINFIGSGLTAADAGAGVTSITMNSFLNLLASQGDVDLTADVTGELPFANIANLAGLSVLGRASNTTGVMAAITAGTDNQVLRRSGTSIGFGAINLASSNAVTGVLDETNGGTGQSTFTTGDILYASAANTLSKLAAGTDNYFLRMNGTIPAWETAASTELSDTANIAYLNGTETISGNWTFSNNITLNATPSAGTDVVNVNYLNSIIANQSRTSVRVATTTAGTLATSFENGDTIDGITLATDDRILIKDQAAPAENGIYVVQSSGAPVRADDMNTAAEVDGTFVIVEDGTTNAGTFWYTISEVTTLGTDAIVWTRLDKATDITAGNGLSFTGLTLNVGTASASRIVVNANDIDLATTSVTPSSYGSATQVATFTVDAYGRLTAAGNTTISVPSSAISDFTESVQDVVGDLVLDTSGVTWSYDDSGNSLEVNVDTIYTADGLIPSATVRTISFEGIDTELLILDNTSAQLLNAASDYVALVDETIQISQNSVTIYGTNTSLIVDDHIALYVTDAASNLTITDTRATTRGIEYAADYSSGYTDRSLVDKEYVDNLVVSATITRGFIEGFTGATVDLDANDGNFKDVDGTNLVMTVATDEAKMLVYRNGVRQAQSGSLTTRDYDFGAGNTITFQTALTSADIVMIEKLS